MTTAQSGLRPVGVVAEMGRQPTILAAAAGRNAQALDAGRSLLRRARCVRLAALGSSRHSAGFGAAAIDFVTGTPAVVLPAVGRAVPLPASADDDVVIAVSQSGATPALIEAAAHARATGAKVIAVVNAVDSPLARLADVVLDCGAAPEHAVAATGSVTSQMLLLRLLAGPLAAHDLAELVGVVDAALRLQPRLPFAAPAHVVAGGFAAEWVADEAALKLAEMAGVLPSADSLVDHLHGPAAVVQPAVAFVDGRDPNARPVIAQPQVYSVGPMPECDLVVAGTTEPTLDAIARVVAAQVVAVHCAIALGVDPDDARGLSKVTESW